MIRIFTIVFLIFLYSCIKPGVQHDVMQQFVPTDSTVTYLLPDADTGRERWMAGELFRMHEPVLYNYVGHGEFLRLTWLRAFDPPAVVRLQRFNDTMYAVIREAGIMDTLIRISLQQWEQITAPLGSNAFRETPAAVEDGGKDGVVWILEVRLQDRYKMIHRWEGMEERESLLRPLLNFAGDYVQLRSGKDRLYKVNKL